MLERFYFYLFNRTLHLSPLLMDISSQFQQTAATIFSFNPPPGQTNSLNLFMSQLFFLLWNFWFTEPERQTDLPDILTSSYNCGWMLGDDPNSDGVWPWCLVINFSILQASVKNFQLCHSHNPDLVIMQLGKVEQDVFIMDFRWQSSIFNLIQYIYCDGGAVTNIFCCNLIFLFWKVSIKRSSNKVNHSSWSYATQF